MRVQEEMKRIYGGGHETYGDDPRAFLHNDRESQYERFSMLAKTFDREVVPFSVHEIGCALGHFGHYLRQKTGLATYSGSDIYEPFVHACAERFPSSNFYLRDISQELPADRYDYVVTCGTFNIPGNAPRDEWQAAIYDMTRAMYAICRKGIALTFLTTYHDRDRTRPELHYQSEMGMLDLSFRELSRHVEIDKTSALYEYAVRVYRPEYIAEQYTQPSLLRYFGHLRP
jgi:hypothetical protein